jgi:dihydroorotate dehydrogenase
MMTVLSTILAGIPFPSCLMNASGAWSGTHKELRASAALATGAVVMKTATTQARVEEVQRGGIEKPQQADYLAALAELKATVFARLKEELSATRTAHGTGA